MLILCTCVCWKQVGMNKGLKSGTKAMICIQLWVLTAAVHTNSLAASDQTLDCSETRNGGAANEARFPHFST